MDRKKLIGTIVGVTLFAALIAGATFAWLTFRANVTDGNYNSVTRVFDIDYVGEDTAITGLPTLTNDAAVASACTGDIHCSATVSAKLANNSANGILSLKLTTKSTTAQEILDSGALSYAVCSGTSTSADCTTLTSGTGVLATGTVTGTFELDANSNKKDLVTVLHTIEPIPAETTYYWMFFWLDASKVTSDLVGDDIQYSGYIHASAVQTETDYSQAG